MRKLIPALHSIRAAIHSLGAIGAAFFILLAGFGDASSAKAALPQAKAAPAAFELRPSTNVRLYDALHSSWKQSRVAKAPTGASFTHGDDVLTLRGQSRVVVRQAAGVDVTKLEGRPNLYDPNESTTYPRDRDLVQVLGPRGGITRLSRLSAGQRYAFRGRIFELRLSMAGDAAEQRYTGDSLNRVFHPVTLRRKSLTHAEIRFPSGKIGTFDATPDHPVYSVDRAAYVPFASLKPGERLTTSDGRGARLGRLSTEGRGLDVFNFGVWNQHSYYVRAGTARPGVLVHNVDCIKTGNGARKGSPKPNLGKGKPHGGKAHNAAIDKEIGKLDADPGVKNIRKNQAQVDVNGDKVGRNRPDIQYDKGGKHYNHEIDTTTRGMNKHKEQIPANDPNAENIFELLK